MHTHPLIRELAITAPLLTSFFASLVLSLGFCELGKNGWLSLQVAQKLGPSQQLDAPLSPTQRDIPYHQNLDSLFQLCIVLSFYHMCVFT